MAFITGTSWAAHGIATWPGNKKAAVSLAFDDGCRSQFTLGVPALNARGIKGTFYLIIDGVSDGFSPPWSSWRSAAAEGHEIASHTISHPHLTWISLSQAQTEITGSKATIETQVPSRKCLSFAYPFGDTNSSVASIASDAYVNSRGVACGLNAEPYDFANLKACSPDSGDDIYVWADAARSQGKWLIAYIHSLDSGNDCWGTWDIDMYTTYLDYLLGGDVWAGTVGGVVKYIKERSAATLSTVSGSGEEIVLSLTDTLDDSIYDQPLTLWSEVPSEWEFVTVQQGTGAVVELTPVLEGGRKVVYYQAVPDRGLITLKDPVPADPRITALSPANVVAGNPAFNLTVNGAGFVSGADVRWNGLNRTTTYVSATQLRAAVLAADVAVPGTFRVSVRNPNGGVSNEANFEVRVVPPVLAAIEPFVTTAGSPAFTLAGSGSNFLPGAKVRWSGSERTTTYVSSTQLQAGIQAADIASAGIYNVTVLNPDGGVSSAVPFEVMGPPPAVSALSPSSASAGSAAFTLTVTGANFVSGAKVRWNGSNRTTTYISSAQLRASISSTDIASQGSFPISVANPDDAVSNAVYFNVTAPPPAITALSPSGVVAGSAAFTLTVSGANFLPGAAVRWNGSGRTTAFVSSAQLQASIPAADIAAAGTYNVTVLNPDGYASNTVSFTVNAPGSVFSITSLSPSETAAGGAAFYLTVDGAKFVSGARVRWNGSSRTTTYVSSTRLRGRITSTDISKAGTFNVTVRNPNGAVSNAISFIVKPPVSAPAITALSPSGAAAGDPAFTLTVSGVDFAPGAAVRWNGSGRTTAYVSPAQLQASIPAADIASAGTYNVTVLNPDGGASGPVQFSVNPGISTPAITALSPSGAIAGGAAFTLTVSGANFVPGAAVRWNGSSRTTAYVSPAQLQASIPAADIASAGTYAVTVLNPDGYASNTFSFTVDTGVSAPAIAALSPSSATAGGASFTLTVFGSNFASGAVVRWNGTDRATSFLSYSQLHASIPAADIASAGTHNVTVLNPDGEASGASPFVVSEAPTYTDNFNRPNQSPLSGNWATFYFGVGTLELYNQQLRSTDINSWNVYGWRTADTYASNHFSQIRSTSYPTGEIGGPAVRMQWNGSQLNGYLFSVLSPTEAAIFARYGRNTVGWEQIGAIYTGTFASGDVYKLDISGDVLTAYRNGISLGSRTDANKRVPSGGMPGVLVVYPGTFDDWAGGNVYASGIPAVASLAPSYAHAGGSGLTLTIDGSNFVAGSVVRWNGSARTTTFVSSTRLQASIPASDLSAAGTAAVTVNTPPPGGGTSNAIAFEILQAAGSVTIDPPTVTGGSSAIGTVTLIDPAPQGGATVTLDSGDPSIVTVPSIVTIPAGSIFSTFPIFTAPVAGSVTVSIVAGYGGYTWTSALTVDAVPLVPVSVTLDPTTVSGGVAGSIGTVTLSGPAQGQGTQVSLVSGNPAVAQVPSSVTIPSGSVSAIFPVSTSAVSASTVVIVSATHGGTTKSATLSVMPSDAPATGHTITAWPGNRKGAVSLTFDDGETSQYTLGVPALNARGMKASFYVITAYNGTPMDESEWTAWRSAAANGHEIGSHTISHPALSTLPYEQMRQEVVESKTEIDSRIPSRKTLTFVYPFGDYNSQTKSVVQENYIAARGVSCGLNEPPYDFYDVKGCTPDSSTTDIHAWTADAEQQGKWLAVYFHSLLGSLENGWGTYEIEDFTAYLDYLGNRDVWVGTFEQAVKFLREKATSSVTFHSSSADRIVLRLADTMDDAIYDQPLTLRSVVPSEWATVNVQQGSGAIDVNPVVEDGARVIYYEAVPDRGLITLRNP
ncbi:MAG: polysaccharide deacetylase family protein [Thermodesulfobacteriota bacterium]